MRARGLFLRLGLVLLASLIFHQPWAAELGPGAMGLAALDVDGTGYRADGLPSGTVTERIEECGTVITPEQAAFELSRDRSEWLKAGTSARQAATYWVPIAFHVVRRTDGSEGLSADRLDVALRDLNMQFEQVGIQFYRDRAGGEFITYYVDSDAYYYGTNNGSMFSALRQEAPVAGQVNVWFVPYTGYCGLASFSTSAVQGIIMDNGCSGLADNPSTLAHEVGHYLDLYHTHATGMFGVECPDGSNCATAGDLLCDTPADPKLSGKVDTWCNYFGNDTLPDGCSGTYDPAVENQMSYGPALCRDTFSPEQIAKMLNTLIVARSDHRPTDSSDTDGDGIMDVIDCCPDIANADQLDADEDHIGDVCDVFPSDPLNDADGDGIPAESDNCPTIANADQTDSDGNGVGDACGCTDGFYYFEGDYPRTTFGWRVRSAGDVDADGIDDIIVGAMGEDVPDTGTGAAYVYAGSDGSLLYRFYGDQKFGNFGNAVTGTGDLNGDGHGDIMIGAWDHDAGGIDAGEVYVFYTGPGPYPITETTTDADRTYTGAQLDVLGSGLGTLKDITGDGVSELLIGAYWNGFVQVRNGATGTLIYSFTADAVGDGFGYSLRDAGDVNNDGKHDIIVGAFRANYAKVYSGDDGSQLYAFYGPQNNAGFGGMVSGAGDVDDDGYDDFMIGSPWHDAGGKNNCGKAQVYSGFSGDVIHVFVGNNRGDMLGWSVDAAGDQNGDGYDDFLIGAPLENASHNSIGKVYLRSGLDGSIMHTFTSDQPVAWFGRDVCGAVDFDNDGTRDLLVGAHQYNGSPGYRSGAAFAYQLGDADGDGILVGCDQCPINLTGDVNEEGSITSADIIALVGYVFKGGAAPLPCEAAGDVNCDGLVTSADIISLVNYVFKGGTPPCDVCTLIPGTWTCP